MAQSEGNFLLPKVSGLIGWVIQKTIVLKSKLRQWEKGYYSRQDFNFISTSIVQYKRYFKEKNVWMRKKVHSAIYRPEFSRSNSNVMARGRDPASTPSIGSLAYVEIVEDIALIKTVDHRDISFVVSPYCASWLPSCYVYKDTEVMCPKNFVILTWICGITCGSTTWMTKTWLSV